MDSTYNNNPLYPSSSKLQWSSKVLGHFAISYSGLNCHPSPPPKHNTMLFYGRSTCDTGLILLSLQRQISRRPNTILLGGMRVRVKRTDEEVKRSMVVHLIFLSVRRTFGGYCKCIWLFLTIDHVATNLLNSLLFKCTINKILSVARVNSSGKILNLKINWEWKKSTLITLSIARTYANYVNTGQLLKWCMLWRSREILWINDVFLEIVGHRFLKENTVLLLGY